LFCNGNLSGTSYAEKCLLSQRNNQLHRESHMMKKAVLGSALATVVTTPTAALAQATSPHSLTANVAITSDYRFRGISQTFGEGFFKPGPAIQGGIDYSHASGLYIGNWNSNVSGNQFPNGASIEMDFYGGWKKTWGDVGLDIGTIYYFYPSSEFSATTVIGTPTTEKPNHWEIYVGGSWKWLSAKYFYSLTNYFGASEDVVVSVVGCNPTTICVPLGRNGDTQGTQYLTGSFNHEILPKLTLGASLGYTWVANYSALDYLDYKVGVTYDWNSWMLGANFIGTNADEKYWYAVNGQGKVRETGKPGLVLSVGRTF
jgi:uncharacterized protein (TIGR02001 family)